VLHKLRKLKGGNYMNFIFIAKGITVSDESKQIIMKKMNKLAKFFTNETEINVKVTQIKQNQAVEVTIIHKGITLRAESTTDDIISSVEKAVDTLERQIRKHKTRLQRRLHTPAFTPDFLQQNGDEEKEFKVVKSKKFNIKPMNIDEAILQMNLLGHMFFVFINIDTNSTNVVYKRKDGDYGLIEKDAN
jgi:putative sigma-54 modulation protein